MTVNGAAGMAAAVRTVVGTYSGTPSQFLEGWAVGADVGGGAGAVSIVWGTQAPLSIYGSSPIKGAEAAAVLGASAFLSAGKTWVTPDEGTRHICEL